MPKLVTSRPPGRLDADLAWQTAIFLASVSLFAWTLGFGWVYDDQMEIVLNTQIRSLRNLPAIFSGTAWAGSGMETYLYRPLPTATFALNYLLSGLDPWSFHLVNVLLQALVCLLVFRVGRSWGLSAAAAGAGGLLFAVHPAHVEVVAAVFGRKDLLAAVFTLGMVLLHRKAAGEGGWWNACPIAAYALAMLSKEVGMMAIVLVAAQDSLGVHRGRDLLRSRRLPLLYVGYLTTLLIYVIVRNAVTGGIIVPDTSYLDNPLVAMSPGTRLLTSVAVLGKGVKLLLFPAVLSPDYSFDAIPGVRSVLDLRLLGTLAVLAACGWALYSHGRRNRILPLAVVWYAATLFPGSNILIQTGTIFGERLLYLPSVAFCLLAGGGLAWAFSRWRRFAPLAMVAALLSYSLRTLHYSSAWKSDLSLFEWATAAVPKSSKAHHKLGEELLRSGSIGPALASLRQALELAPGNEFASHTLSIAQQQVAREFLTPSGELDPRRALPRDPEVLYLLGQMGRQRGNMAQAEVCWEAAVAQDPPHPESLADLGVLRLSQGDTIGSVRLLEQSVRLQPSLAHAWYTLARIHLARNETGEGIQALREFVRTAGARFPEEVRWARDILSRGGG